MPSTSSISLFYLVVNNRGGVFGIYMLPEKTYTSDVSVYRVTGFNYLYDYFLNSFVQRVNNLIKPKRQWYEGQCAHPSCTQLNSYQRDHFVLNTGRLTLVCFHFVHSLRSSTMKWSCVSYLRSYIELVNTQTKVYTVNTEHRIRYIQDFNIHCSLSTIQHNVQYRYKERITNDCKCKRWKECKK